MQRFFALCAILLAATLSMSITHAEEDILTAYAKNNTALLPFRDEIIVAEATPDAAQKTHDAILNGAKARAWTVVSDTPAAIRLTLIPANKKHTLTLDVHIKGNKADFVYVSSNNLNYEKLPGGQEVIHPKYNAWIKNILKSARADGETRRRGRR